MRDTDCISNLDFTTLCQTSSYHILCYPTAGISSGTINLRRVFSGEGTATMTPHTAIGINDDLTACQSSITQRSANYKASSWVYINFDFSIHQLLWNYRIDNMLNNRSTNFFLRNLRCMLGTDKYGINPCWFPIMIFNCYLAFPIGA